MTPTKLGPKGEALMKKWEGYSKDLGNGKVQAYPDPATGGAPWTIGWGSTGPDIVKGTVWTREQAQQRFDNDATKFVTGVAKALAGAPATQNQFDAMVSLAYNVGQANFNASTLLRKHRAGDFSGAAAQFAAWNKAAGKPMAGLTARRADEAKLYGTPA
ncbi:GH24 family phage-related lysozyme (muramidase) [Novosphingobium sp. PhB165]|uniref:lysozyme n=1 Tax=Novosphingobium sp. PhB165 TaxID=2485105 RepID=UPI001051DB06|nr:lysozyme [Novosphingobium sp. PhB165]TCM21467.1 GH24 family phage-related lysozyme (muramidase) [Novosphingobium sp. PhB165]